MQPPAYADGIRLFGEAKRLPPLLRSALPSLWLLGSRHRLQRAQNEHPVALASALSAFDAVRQAGALAMFARYGEFFVHQLQLFQRL